MTSTLQVPRLCKKNKGFDHGSCHLAVGFALNRTRAKAVILAVAIITAIFGKTELFLLFFFRSWSQRENPIRIKTNSPVSYKVRETAKKIYGCFCLLIVSI